MKDDIAEFGLSAEALVGWEQAVRYQGFDVKVLLKKIRQSYESDPIKHGEETVSFTFKAGTEDKTFEYSKQEHIMKDIAMILYMFANRGTSWEHLKSKSRKGFQDIMT